MSHHGWLISWAGVSLVSFLFLSGCTSQEPRLYVLSGVSMDRPPPDLSGREVAVGVGPMDLPDYLDRPQIVTRSGQNEIFVADFDRWAEPLKANAIQCLTEDLSAYLGSRRVVSYPWRRAVEVDAQVIVKVIRFDRIEGGDAELRVRWSILGSDGKSELLVREKSYLTKPQGDGFEATVLAMNRALHDFALEVAQAIRSLSLAKSTSTR